jgi:exodeoxyribonuclease-3
MKILTWNVNGYNTQIHQVLIELVNDEQADIIFLTEIKCKADKIKPINGYTWLINSNIPANYHGVAMLIKDDIEFKEQRVNLNIPARYDTKSSSAATGRVITIKIHDTYLVGVYSPNSGVNGLKNLNQRINTWDKGLASYLDMLGNNVILIGDLNIAFSNKDVSDPGSMKHWPGFTIEERKSFKSKMVSFHDVYREFDPDGVMYTWIGNNPRRGYGMRLDHIMINNDNLLNDIESLLFYESIVVSDHIPIGCIIKLHD